jgi:hypothetical protein
MPPRLFISPVLGDYVRPFLGPFGRKNDLFWPNSAAIENTLPFFYIQEYGKLKATPVF